MTDCRWRKRVKKGGMSGGGERCHLWTTVTLMWSECGHSSLLHHLLLRNDTAPSMYIYPVLLGTFHKCTYAVFVCVCVCFKVLDWIENHGEAFLSKHTGVGKSLHRARALQKRHEDFEEVAQVSFKSNEFGKHQGQSVSKLKHSFMWWHTFFRH